MAETESNPTEIVRFDSSVTNWDAQGHCVRVADSMESVATGDETEPSKEAHLIETIPLFTSQLPFDTASILALEPMHSVIQYRLAYYHLDCARRRLSPDNDVAFVPELSCSGRSRFSPRDPSFDWTSEVYYNSGSFLQRQEMSFKLDKEHSNYPHLNIRVCHHQYAHFLSWQVKDRDGQLAVSVKVCFSPGRFKHDLGLGWKNDQGANLAELHVCTRCQCDFEYNIEVVGRQAHVRFACYRDLGTATDRFEPQWRCHLTPKGLREPRRLRWSSWNAGEPPYRIDSPTDYELYRRVWQTARRLERPNLQQVTFETNSGVFQSSSEDIFR
ncbi:uncharacterized protein PG986_010960 [Apiospora aurea]|uniref:Uncharacterized protein n=1 Tax=Apiospora aurea TaxID=335848 RepID=A0ABR1Q3Q6_9PEZI